MTPSPADGVATKPESPLPRIAFWATAIVLIVASVVGVNNTADAAPPPTARPSAYPTYPKPSPTDPLRPSPSASPTESKFQPPNLDSPPPSSSPVAPTTRSTPRPTVAQPQVTPSPSVPAVTSAAPSATSASSPVPTTTSAPSPSATTPTATSSGTTLTYTPVKTTGYGLRDNDCGGPGDCTAYGDGHAGGVGTYTDPVSVAVGGRWLPAGTLMYIPYLHRYGIVEDTCGACTGAWIDIWVNGSATTEQAAELCMRSITGRHTIVLNPPPGLPEDAGVISTADGCARQYGDTV